MKKFEVRSLLAFLLAAMMVFTLAACQDADDTLPPDSDVTEPVETEPTETDPVETDPVETDPVETDPPATEPVETDPPKQDPVETDPPVTEPAETDPPATEPVATDCEHVYGAGKKVNATCQSEGGTEYTCKKCGETKMENVTPKTDHLYVATILVNPGCESEGEAAEQCTFCGAVLNSQILMPRGHSYATSVVPMASPTHHSANVTSCTTCGDVASAEGYEAHTFTFVERVKDSESSAGVKSYGFELYECSCGYVRKVMSNHTTGHYYEVDAGTGKYICGCENGDDYICSGDFVHNGNENAGPVVSIQD